RRWRLRQTAGRRWPALPGTGRCHSFGYCGAMAPSLHPSHVHAPNPGFGPGFVGRVLDDALAHGARIHAISSLQGSGKSTLATQLASAAAERGLYLACVSIDDFYLDLDARQRLARQVHPLLATRGPPGTHDLALAIDTLDA